jgi:site-specific recombinase XerC
LFSNFKRLAFKLQNPRLLKINFHTFRHWKGTMPYHQFRDLRAVQKVLGHRSILNTQIYEHIEEALFQKPSDESHVKTATTVEEAVKLVEVGFEYVNTIDGVHIYRKRK